MSKFSFKPLYANNLSVNNNNYSWLYRNLLLGESYYNSSWKVIYTFAIIVKEQTGVEDIGSNV